MLINDDQTFCVTECGIVTAMSKHAILLIPFYYIPMVLLLVLVVLKFTKRLKLHYKPRLDLFLYTYNMFYIILKHNHSS